jgi:hypothetical protein
MHCRLCMCAAAGDRCQSGAQTWHLHQQQHADTACSHTHFKVNSDTRGGGARVEIAGGQLGNVAGTDWGSGMPLFGWVMACATGRVCQHAAVGDKCRLVERCWHGPTSSSTLTHPPKDGALGVVGGSCAFAARCCANNSWELAGQCSTLTAWGGGGVHAYLHVAVCLRVSGGVPACCPARCVLAVLGNESRSLHQQQHTRKPPCDECWS